MGSRVETRRYGSNEVDSTCTAPHHTCTAPLVVAAARRPPEGSSAMSTTSSRPGGASLTVVAQIELVSEFVSKANL
jgi:hypothetical protein